MSINPTLLAGSVLVVAAAPLALGAEHIERQMGAHVHGAAELNAVVDGNTLAMELHLTGIDAVGFGHPPESDEDQAAVDSAIATLEDAANLFQIPAAAGCELVNAAVEVEYGMEEHHDEHHHGEDHHDDEHDAHHGEKEGSHSEFHASYEYSCGAMDQLESLTVMVFESFSNLETVRVQRVSPAGQGAQDLSADAPVVEFN
ncbi:MAG: DUF2796 domain-containing protein [Candidatus Competibacterales bacterium]